MLTVFVNISNLLRQIVDALGVNAVNGKILNKPSIWPSVSTALYLLFKNLLPGKLVDK